MKEATHGCRLLDRDLIIAAIAGVPVERGGFGSRGAGWARLSVAVTEEKKYREKYPGAL